MIPPFIFESERLRFRETCVEDAETMFALNSDPNVLKYTGDVPWQSAEEARVFLANYSDFKRNKMGRWAAVRKSDGALIGWCGLKLLPNGQVDLGYRLFAKFWNQGYATEASLANLAYGFNVLNLPEIIGRVLPEHKASTRVLQKVGMQFLKNDIDELNGAEIHVYLIDRNTFRKEKV